MRKLRRYFEDWLELECGNECTGVWRVQQMEFVAGKVAARYGCATCGFNCRTQFKSVTAWRHYISKFMRRRRVYSISPRMNEYELVSKARSSN